MGNDAGDGKGAKLIALVGPAGAGKTSLAEALLHAAGAVSRQGRVDDGNTVGDASAEGNWTEAIRQWELFKSMQAEIDERMF